MTEFDRIPLLGRHAWIEHRARSYREGRDVTEPGVHPIAERPLDRLPIMDIDVVIDHDEMLARVIGEMASPQSRRNLLRVTTMAFANLDAQELGPLAAPNPGHIRHPRL